MIFGPDGKQMVFEMMGLAERGLKSWNMEGGEQPRTLVSSKFELTPLGFSADGRYVAYSSFQTGHPRIYLKQFHRVRGNGRSRGCEANSRPGPAVDRNTTSGDRLSLFWGFSAAMDRKRLLTVRRQQSDGDVSGMVVVQNWWAEFQDRGSRSR